MGNEKLYSPTIKAIWDWLVTKLSGLPAKGEWKIQLPGGKVRKV
jgi:hypothetical protein